MKKLWKSTIIIWSDEDMQNAELTDLANDATSGGSICTKQETVLVEDSKADPDCAVGEFFYSSLDDEGDDCEDEAVVEGTGCGRADFDNELCCQRCGSELYDVDGHCRDETCPYSDRKQDETFVEG